VGGQAAVLAQLLADHATEPGRAGWSWRSFDRACRRAGGVPRHRDRRRAWHVAVHCFLEVARPAAAAELAIGVDVDADVLLHLQHAQDLAVLDLAELVD
jgi:hypothetical protein